MLYPLRFRPIFRQSIWGGRRLKTSLGKSIGDGNDFAESWEIVDHGADQSVVRTGTFEGMSLGELVVRHGQELLGRHHPRPRFPLLLKFLDAHRDLSVQVHPNDKQGSQLDPPDLGKTEAWVILEAEPGSKVYAGLSGGVGPDELRQAIGKGMTESCLHQVEVKPGDCLFIPAGTVHALGSGLVVFEVQQASDATYRLFDWNRVDADGKPRQLHIEEAMGVINFDYGPVDPVSPLASEDLDVVRLVNCDKFVLDRWSFNRRGTIPDDQRCHLLAVLSGSVTVEQDASGAPLTRGQTMLVPASCGELTIATDESTVLLDMYLP